MFQKVAFYLFISLPLASIAETPKEIANKVLSHFSQIQVPNKSSNSFEKWTYDTSSMTAITCWISLNKGSAIPPQLKDVRPSGAGAWLAPKPALVTKLCKSIAANGIKPVCTHTSLWAEGVKRLPNLPRDYIQLQKVHPLNIKGTFGCYLNKDQVNKQDYVGEIKATWREKPMMKSINTAIGKRTLNVGTLMIASPNVVGLDGKAYIESKLAVLIPNP